MELQLKNSREITELLGQRVRRERMVRNMTQQELAARAGVSHATVSNMEQGRSITLDNFLRIAMILGRTAELEALLVPRLLTVDDVLQHNEAANRQRIRSKRDDGQAG